MRINEKFELHDTLNPKLWDIETNQLKDEVRDKIIDVVIAFEDYIDTPIKILDIQLVGSNASYNWNDTSDLDVHIIANYDVVTKDNELLQSLYDSKKTQFNNNFDITIHGIDIEMYVQDVRSGITSNGIYSICDNKWIKFPKQIEVPDIDTTKEVEKWSLFINRILEEEDYNKINDTIDTLYLIRHNSIAKDGEYGKGNQLFKDLRSLGLLDKLKEVSRKGLARKLSLESLTGEFDDDMEFDKNDIRRR